MSIRIQDAATDAEFKSATGAESVLDSSGRLIGLFTPRVLSPEEYAEHDLTEEEMEAMLKDPNVTWHTADEVMARLRSLTKERG